MTDEHGTASLTKTTQGSVAFLSFFLSFTDKPRKKPRQVGSLTCTAHAWSVAQAQASQAPFLVVSVPRSPCRMSSGHLATSTDSSQQLFLEAARPGNHLSKLLGLLISQSPGKQLAVQGVMPM